MYVGGVGWVKVNKALIRLTRRALFVPLLMSMTEAFSVFIYTLIKLCYTKALEGSSLVPGPEAKSSLEIRNLAITLKLGATPAGQSCGNRSDTAFQGGKKVKVKSLSRVQLFQIPWTVAHQAPLSMGFSRQAYWSGLPFPSPGDLSNPGIEPQSPTLQADALTSEPPGKPPGWR